jgi:hypothetical protein
MASAELSRRVETVVGYPPLSEMNDGRRRELHEALLDGTTFEDLPGKWQVSGLKPDWETVASRAPVSVGNTAALGERPGLPDRPRGSGRSCGGRRHGRAPAGVARSMGADFDPALFPLSDELIERAEKSVDQEDSAEMSGAEAYWDSIGSEERERRRAEHYSDRYAYYHPKHGEVRVDECQVCRLTAFVAEQFDRYVDEIGVGVCVACSYRRSQTVADDQGMMRAIGRIS